MKVDHRHLILRVAFVAELNPTTVTCWTPRTFRHTLDPRTPFPVLWWLTLEKPGTYTGPGLSPKSAPQITHENDRRAVKYEQLQRQTAEAA
jgi:hypothetical protein